MVTMLIGLATDIRADGLHFHAPSSGIAGAAGQRPKALRTSAKNAEEIQFPGCPLMSLP